MLLKLLRRHLRTRTVAALLALAICGSTHVRADDPGCAPVLSYHDHAAHRFTTSTNSPASPADHCNLCHLQRLLHTALSAQSFVATIVHQTETRRPTDAALTASTFSFTLPSRAPPASQL